MDNLIISALGFVFFVILLGISRIIGNDVSLFRKIAKYLAYLVFLFLIIVGFVNYFNEKPFIQKISTENYEFLINFPDKPTTYDVDEGVKGLKSLINRDEFYLIYTNAAADNSIKELSANFEKIIEEQNLQVTYKTIGEDDSYFIFNPPDEDYFVYKKLVLYDGMFLDFNVKSKNQFPNDIAKAFLDYKIEER